MHSIQGNFQFQLNAKQQPHFVYFKNFKCTCLTWFLSVQSIVNGFISLNNMTAAICLNAIDTLEKGEVDKLFKSFGWSG